MLKLITVIILGLTSANSFAAQYEVSPSESQISFKARGNPSFISISGQAPAAKGSLTEMDNAFSGEVLIDTHKITTGIDLRDSHFKDNYLEVAKFPMAKVTFSNVQLQESESDFVADLTLHGVTKKISGKAQRENDRVKANFTVDLNDFAIKIPSYQGITVAQDVVINVDLKTSAGQKP